MRLDIYDVYDTCGDDSGRTRHHAALGGKPLHAPSPAGRLIGDAVSCVPDGSSDFMNNADVRKALHVDKAPVGTWSDCSGIDYHSNLVSLIPTYPKLIANMNVRLSLSNNSASTCGPARRPCTWTLIWLVPVLSVVCVLRCALSQVLIYSGDADACVPSAGNTSALDVPSRAWSVLLTCPALHVPPCVLLCCRSVS